MYTDEARMNSDRFRRVPPKKVFELAILVQARHSKQSLSPRLNSLLIEENIIVTPLKIILYIIYISPPYWTTKTMTPPLPTCSEELYQEFCFLLQKLLYVAIHLASSNVFFLFAKEIKLLYHICHNKSINHVNMIT